MKKIALTALLSAFAMSAAQAADYPDACVELEELTIEAGEVMPEMKAQLDAVANEEERKAAAREAWNNMSEQEQEQAATTCEAGVEQMKKVIEMAKAQK